MGSNSTFYFATVPKDDGTLDIEASEDGKTFTAHLNAPCAYFLDLCAFPAFYPVPQQAVEAADGADTNPGAWALEAGFVGSGPFVLTEWKHGTYIYLSNRHRVQFCFTRRERIAMDRQ